MSRKIIGVTVGTPISPNSIKEKMKPVLSVNGEEPDANGDVKVTATFEDLTDADKAKLVSAVIDELPVYNGEVVEE